VRLRPHKLLPAHLLQVLASSLEAGVGNDEQWEVLLRALQKQRHELGLQVITRECAGVQLCCEGHVCGVGG
jgi:hypothetical protein